MPRVLGGDARGLEESSWVKPPEILFTLTRDRQGWPALVRVRTGGLVRIRRARCEMHHIRLGRIVSNG